jgi:hypothetical protein
MAEVNTVDIQVVRKKTQQVSSRIAASPVLDRAEDIYPGVTVTRIEYQNWGIYSADYNFGQGPVEPDIGDRIINLDTNEKFDVVSRLDDMPCFEYTKGDRTRMVVYSVRVKE